MVDFLLTHEQWLRQTLSDREVNAQGRRSVWPDWQHSTSSKFPGQFPGPKEFLVMFLYVGACQPFTYPGTHENSNTHPWGLSYCQPAHVTHHLSKPQFSHLWSGGGGGGGGNRSTLWGLKEMLTVKAIYITEVVYGLCKHKVTLGSNTFPKIIQQNKLKTLHCGGKMMPKGRSTQRTGKKFMVSFPSLISCPSIPLLHTNSWNPTWPYDSCLSCPSSMSSNVTQSTRHRFSLPLHPYSKLYKPQK